MALFDRLNSRKRNRPGQVRIGLAVGAKAVNSEELLLREEAGRHWLARTGGCAVIFIEPDDDDPDPSVITFDQTTGRDTTFGNQTAFADAMGMSPERYPDADTCLRFLDEQENIIGAEFAERIAAARAKGPDDVRLRAATIAPVKLTGK